MAAPKSSRRALGLVPSLILLAALGLRTSGLSEVESLQNKVFDSLQALRPRPRQPAPVRVIDIDDESLKRLGAWPWPRAQSARLVSRLSELGAKTVAFDIVFAEPERSDPALVKAMAKTAVVTGFTLSSHPNETFPALKSGFAYSGDAPLRHLPDFPGAVSSLPAFEAAAAGNGGFSLVPESDGVIRRLPLLLRRGEALYPSLALEALRVHQRAEGILVKTGPNGIRSVKTGAITIPTDGSARLRLHFSPSAPARTIPAWRLLESGFPQREVQGVIAFVGSSAQRLQDLRPTPLGPSIPGVEIHAQVAEQALGGRFLLRPFWADVAELGFMLALGVVLIVWLPTLGAARGALLGLGAAASAFPLAWWAYIRPQWLLDPLYPALALLAVYTAASLVAYLETEAERRRLVLLDELKDEMLSVASHDLRGPVNAMIMIVDAMATGQFGTLNEKQTHYLKLINNQGRKLNDFVANILDTARIKAGKLELRRQAVSPQEVVATAAEVFALAADSKRVTLESRAVPGLPPVYADREKLEQMLNNLLGNALKFTREGGRIEVSAEADGEQVRFSVADTGMGIAAGELSKLFRRFSQADLGEQKSMGIQGTGLGLSICRELAEAHGGRIWVESEKGKGSSFHFTIPNA